MKCRKCGENNCESGFCRLAKQVKIHAPTNKGWLYRKGWEIGKSYYHNHKIIKHCIELVELLPGAMLFDYKQIYSDGLGNSYYGIEIFRSDDYKAAYKRGKEEAKKRGINLII